MMAHHGVLHVGVYSRLLRVDTNLDRIVHTPAKKRRVSLQISPLRCIASLKPLDGHENMQKSRCRRPHRLGCVISSSKKKLVRDIKILNCCTTPRNGRGGCRETLCSRWSRGKLVEWTPCAADSAISDRTDNSKKKNANVVCVHVGVQ